MTVIRILNSPKATIIPCVHEESGCSGLFNTITNEFYPVKTTEFEYIQSAETQYIDTGVQPKGGRMKEYIEREAVVKLAWLADYGDVVNLHDIMDIPAADVVEVVRCKDCQHYYNSVCTNTGLAGTNIFMNPFDYCSYGAKMDEEE